MNKLLVALIAGAFASVAAAQTAAPKPTTKERQEAVKSTTQSGVDQPLGAVQKQQEANVKASKEVAKPTSKERQADTKATTAAAEEKAGDVQKQQAANVEASKGQPKANVDIKSKEGQKALEKDLQQKSSR